MGIGENYQRYGFVRIAEFISASDLVPLKTIVEDFHQSWLKDNQSFYQQRAINSNGLTAPTYLTDSQRLALFQLIASDKITKVLNQVMQGRAFFVNTQLFFDPANPSQANYWHRDCQYDLNLETQQRTLSGPEALHLRIALKDEPGLGLVPGSHRNWDSSEELQVRLQQNGHRSSEDLSTGAEIRLSAGDLLVFSANMIHRGLYGQDRMALDLLFAEEHPKLESFWQKQYMPSAAQLALVENPYVFTRPGV